MPEPLRIIRAAACRTTNDKRTIWGLTLECGHYLERNVLPKYQARCKDCENGTPSVPARVVACVGCSGAGVVTPEMQRCNTCMGFKHVEWRPADFDCHTPRPGSPGDHIVAMWAGSRVDNVMVVTVIVKRGRRWLSEVTNVRYHPTAGPTMQRAYFHLPEAVSQESHIETQEAVQDGREYTRRVFVELRTADHNRLQRATDLCIKFLMAGWEEDRG